MPARQFRGRVHQQDTQGRVRLQGAVLDAARASGEAERLRQLVQQLQAPLDVRLHEPGRVRIDSAGSLSKVPKKVLPIQFQKGVYIGFVAYWDNLSQDRSLPTA